MSEEKALVLPPLRTANLDALQIHEDRLTVVLLGCWNVSHSDFDHTKGYEILCSYAVELFQLYLGFCGLNRKSELRHAFPGFPESLNYSEAGGLE